MSTQLPPGFFTRPPPVLLESLAMGRLIKRYESLLASWSKVLSCLAAHARDIDTGVKPCEGGFSLPYAWQADLPPVVDLNVTEDADAGRIVVRFLDPTPHIAVPSPDGGWRVPDLQKRTEDATLKGS